MNPIEAIAKYKDSVAKICLKRRGETIGNGSAFLVSDGIVTNSHVITKQYDAMSLMFDNSHSGDPNAYIHLTHEEVGNAMKVESPEQDYDYAFLQLSNPTFKGRPRLKLGDCASLAVGEQVLFMGFPFEYDRLTCHVGYVSSIYKNCGADMVQIDGSINGGNSGGPLIDLKTGKVAGIITRAETGFIKEQFDELLGVLRNYEEILKDDGTRPTMTMGDVEILATLRDSFASLKQMATNVERSANVGIGFAVSARYLGEAISR